MGHKTKELPEKFESQSSGRIEIWSTVENSARHTAPTGLQSNTETGRFRTEPAFITKQISLPSVVTELIVLMMVSGGPIDHC